MVSELRYNCFAQVDASDIDGDYEITLAKEDADAFDSDEAVTMTASFQTVSEPDGYQMERRLDEMAENAIEEAGITPAENIGYELIKEDNSTRTEKEVAFVVTEPHF